MKAFAVGSLWFGYKKLENDDIPSSIIHIAAIRSALESIPTVKDLKINNENPELMGVVDLDDDLLPIYSHFHVQFSIVIPNRIQERILGRKSRNASTECFLVDIYHAYDSVVSYVSFDHDELNDHASDAIVVVRKYLQEEFDKNKENATFITLGPSPFHANFKLVKAKEFQKDDFIFSEILDYGAGYSDFIVTYKPDLFESMPHAWHYLKYSLKDEIAFYYK